MKKKKGSIFIISIVLFVIQIGIGNTSISNSSVAMKPGTASGKLKVNGQAFFIKYAYAKKTNYRQDDTNKTAFLVLLTNRPFPEDLSKLDRLDLNRFANRYDIQGVVIGIDENQYLLFTDILRLTTITGAIKFKSSVNEEGLIEGRLYTEGEKQFLNDKFEFDITFSVKL